jgi:2-hydroxy-6-oxo-6-(2'-aminophenyl)hexa-2,4-dienoate hydrolase
MAPDGMYTVHESQSAPERALSVDTSRAGRARSSAPAQELRLKETELMTTSGTADPEFARNYLDVDGIRTHYLEAGAGPTLVLIHGGGAGADAWGNWRGCIPLFAPDFHVVAVDMVGFGRTDKPDPARFAYTQEDRNAHMIGFIERLNAGAVYLIGNSMGGATTLGVAMRRPDLVRKMVLMGAAGIAVDNPDPEARKALAFDFTREGMRRLMGALAGPRYAIDEQLVDYRLALACEPDARAALLAMRAGKLTYPEHEVAKIKVPTLVVGGKLDRIAVPARIYRFLELLENSWGFILPHCGHWVMMEAPEEFTAITRAFFRQDAFRVPP